MMIVGQRDGMDDLATVGFVRRFRPLMLVKATVIVCATIALAGLYIGTKYWFAGEDFAGVATRVFPLDIAESCLNRVEPPPVFEAREGDSIVLKVTSLYAGELYLHGLETESSIKPGLETTVSFTAVHAGRYFLHLHGNDDDDQMHAELAILEVSPR